MRICSVKHTKSVSGQHAPTFDLSCNQRLNLAQSLKIKIQWCCYSNNNIQDTTKAKGNLIRFGLPPRSASLKPLARHGCNDAHKRIRVEAQKRASKEQRQTTFKSNQLPMHGHLETK